MCSMYQPFNSFLSSQRTPVGKSINLSFDEIGRIIGKSLPLSARKHRAWWSNQTDSSNRPQAHAWLEAGFKVQIVTPKNGTVIFVKEREENTSFCASRSAARGENKITLPDTIEPSKLLLENGTDTIVLVSCVKSKRTAPCAAKEMYISPLFQGMFRYAQGLHPAKIFILSAEYGLLRPDDIITPYEKTLKKMETHERKVWAERVLAKLRQEADLQSDRFVFLAGMPYRENLISHIAHYEVPMEGLSFGKQLKWLTEKAAS